MRDPGDASLDVHHVGELFDPTGAAQVWFFQTGPVWWSGLLLGYRQEAPNGVWLRNQGFSWGQTPVSYNPFISGGTTTLDPGASYQQVTPTLQS